MTSTTHRPLVMTALVLAMLLAAMEATIVATAMPSIAASVGGFSWYGWVFSSYLLMQAVTTPVFGKLADLYGRKPVFLVGTAIFLAGSALCALAPTMQWLVFFRLLQGTGAGAITPTVITLAGDLYTLAERGKVQAYLSSVWGISSIVGPLAGGLIVEHFGWPWIFWINLPIGLFSGVLMTLCLHEKVEKRRLRLDLLGAFLLLLGLGALMLSLTLGRFELAVLALVAGAFFVWQERRAPDPVVQLALWRQPVVLRGNLTVLAIGIAMLGLIGFVPTYVQAVLGYSPLVAGFAMSAMCIGWPLSAMLAGRLLLSIGVRSLVRSGAVISLAGAGQIALTASYGPVWVGVGSFLVGVGFGLLNTSFMIAIQTSVPWEKRGMATSGVLLMRNLGNSLGASALGALLNDHMRHLGMSLDQVRDLMTQAAQLPLLRIALGESLQLVFWAVFAAVALGGMCAWNVPNLLLASLEPSDNVSGS